MPSSVGQFTRVDATSPTSRAPQPPSANVTSLHASGRCPDYAGALNYAYHLDAGKFARLLARHGSRATRRSGMCRDHVTGVERGARRDDRGCWHPRDRAGSKAICSLIARVPPPSDLGRAYGVPFEDVSDMLFNDRALAIQVPQEPDAPLASQTNATAHEAGWIWDIGLPKATRCRLRVLRAAYQRWARRGDIAFLSGPGALRRRRGDRGSARLLRFAPVIGSAWQGNCLASGQSAGFLEPLEASAIVMVELGSGGATGGLPPGPAALVPRARRFNALMRYRWERIVEFLKLHYILSRREDPYWRDHRDPDTMPARLAELLELWRERPPLAADFSALDEVFPSASWQYVLYGMGFPAPPLSPIKYTCIDELQRAGRAARSANA